MLNNKEKNRRILAIDYGDRRIGLSVGDSQFRIAFPRGVIQNISLESTIQSIVTFIEKEKINTLVIGVPFCSTQSDQEEKTKQFIDTLRMSISIPIEIWDERFTTHIAKKRLSHDGISTRTQKSMKDEQAAILMLEEYFRQESL